VTETLSDSLVSQIKKFRPTKILMITMRQCNVRNNRSKMLCHNSTHPELCGVPRWHRGVLGRLSNNRTDDSNNGQVSDNHHGVL
jgi:hypothetical protein